MKVGDTFEITKEFIHLPGSEFQTTFSPGDKFKVIGYDYIRGFDIQNIETGEKILETRFIFSKLEFKLIKEKEG